MNPLYRVQENMRNRKWGSDLVNGTVRSKRGLDDYSKNPDRVQRLLTIERREEVELKFQEFLHNFNCGCVRCRINKKKVNKRNSNLIGFKNSSWKR